MKTVDQRIKERATLFVIDNPRQVAGLTHQEALVVVESAMLIVASIVYEVQAEEDSETS